LGARSWRIFWYATVLFYHGAIRKLSDEDIADIRKFADRYIVKMKQYLSEALKPIRPE
jgi:hypothetical protein